MTKRKVTESVKKTIAGRQSYKCANNPLVNLIFGYKCPLYTDSREGIFGEEGYEIDHIIELCNGGTNDKDNLQALCLSCHRVKTKRLHQDQKESEKEVKKKIKKVEKEKVKEEKVKDEMIKKLDTENFIKRFNLNDCLYKYTGANNLGVPNFQKLERGLTYNILNETNCSAFGVTLASNIFIKRDEKFELDLIEYIYNHRERNPLGVNVNQFLHFSRLSDLQNKGKIRYLIKSPESDPNNLQYNQLGYFLQNLNELFPEKFNCLTSIINL